MSLHIVTLAEAKAQLGIEDTSEDTNLTEWIEGLQGRFDGHCRRRFLYSAAETEYLDGGCRALEVRRWPIDAIASIIVDQDQEWNAADALTEVEDFIVNYRRGRIVYGAGSSPWPAGFQNVRIVYSGGFCKLDNGAVVVAHALVVQEDLDALRRAFSMQLGFEWRNRKTLGVATINASGASVSVNPPASLAEKGRTFLPEVEQTLQPFVRE